jgi:hypothetical protein
VREKTTLYIPNGYGKHTIIKDLKKEYWIVGDVICKPIYDVFPMDTIIAETLLRQGNNLLVATE